MKLTRNVNNLEVLFNVIAIKDADERGKCITIDEIDWNGLLYSEEENQIIQDYIWENGGWEDILEQIKSNNY